jgi:putative transposase
METQTIRKTCTYKLKPTPDQEQVLGSTLLLCRHSYNAAIGKRREAWHKCGVTVTYYQQQAELPGIKEALPECGEVNAQVLQDVVVRLDRAFQAFVRRLREGQTPGYPRFHGRDRYKSFTCPQVGEHGGARLDTGFLVLSKIGRIAVRWSRPLEGTIKTVAISREADGWYACFSCADMPAQSLPITGQETGIDLGIEAFALRWHTHLLSWLVPQSRTGAQDRPTACQSSQDRRRSPSQGGGVAGEGASDSAPPATGLSPQDGARSCTQERYNLS